MHHLVHRLVGSVIIVGVAAVAGSSVAHARPPTWGAGLGLAEQVVGEGNAGSLSLGGDVGVPLQRWLVVEAVTQVAIAQRDFFDDVLVHGFLGAGLRVGITDRLHVAVAGGMDKLWLTDAYHGHAIVPAIRAAVGLDVVARPDWRLAFELDGFSAAFYDAHPGEGSDFHDERLVLGLGLRLSHR